MIVGSWSFLCAQIYLTTKNYLTMEDIDMANIVNLEKLVEDAAIGIAKAIGDGRIEKVPREATRLGIMIEAGSIPLKVTDFAIETDYSSFVSLGLKAREPACSSFFFFAVWEDRDLHMKVPLVDVYYHLKRIEIATINNEQAPESENKEISSSENTDKQHLTEAFAPIDQTLAERGNRYGEFSGHAEITQGIKLVMIDSPNWQGLSYDKREALEMIAHKIGRILNGDPEYKDSWHDIIGYAKLVEDTLED